MIAILDFGSQYTKLIARKIRECNIYCEVLPHSTTVKQLEECKAEGIILSGGPRSILTYNIFNNFIPL